MAIIENFNPLDPIEPLEQDRLYYIFKRTDKSWMIDYVGFMFYELDQWNLTIGITGTEIYGFETDSDSVRTYLEQFGESLLGFESCTDDYIHVEDLLRDMSSSYVKLGYDSPEFNMVSNSLGKFIKMNDGTSGLVLSILVGPTGELVFTILGESLGIKVRNVSDVTDATITDLEMKMTDELPDDLTILGKSIIKYGMSGTIYMQRNNFNGTFYHEIRHAW